MFQCVYRKSDKQFKEGSPSEKTYDAEKEDVAVLSRLPDFRIERCDDSDPLNKTIRAATQQEMDAYDEAKKTAKAIDVFDTQVAFLSFGEEVLDKFDAAIAALNQCRDEAVHTRRATIQPIDRAAFWAAVKARYKARLL